jgi:hypothetical protein
MIKTETPQPTYVVPSGYTREMALESVGKGWASFIHDIFDRLEALNRPDIRIIQVKQKFGGLRIYLNGVYFDDEHEGEAAEFERYVFQRQKESFYTCETCGNPGTLRSGNHYQTLCDTHAEGRPSIRPF